MENNIMVRPATTNDLEAVFRFICQLENDMFDLDLFREVYESNLSDPNCHYYLAIVEMKPVGFISLQIQNLLHHCGRVGEIQEFYIDMEVRGRGVGRALMDEVKGLATANELKSLEVTSNRKRTENVGIYEHLGFELTHNKLTIAIA